MDELIEEIQNRTLNSIIIIERHPRIIGKCTEWMYRANGNQLNCLGMLELARHQLLND